MSEGVVCEAGEELLAHLRKGTGGARFHTRIPHSEDCYFHHSLYFILHDALSSSDYSHPPLTLMSKRSRPQSSERIVIVS